MTSKELKRLMRDSRTKEVYVAFHGLYIKSTKTEIIWACTEFPNKEDWEAEKMNVRQFPERRWNIWIK